MPVTKRAHAQQNIFCIFVLGLAGLSGFNGPPLAYWLGFAAFCLIEARRMRSG